MSNERWAEYMEETPKTWIQGLFEESSTQKYPLGTVRKLTDGREFIYVKNGTANLVAGELQRGVAPDVANLANLAITANQAIGDREISFTMGACTGTANEANAFAEGYAYINTGTGAGHGYKIKNHAAILANANGTIYLYDKIRVALTAASSKLSIARNPCREIVLQSGGAAVKVGVSTYVMTANYYGWLQKRGPCAVLANAATLVAGDIVAEGATDGSIGVDAANQYPVGMVVVNNADTHFALVDLKL